MAQDIPLLALDTGSPVVSLALEIPGREVLCRTLELRRSSEELLPTIDLMVREAGVHLSDLGGLVALAGPGSFTGLRVGLAVTLGLHQALGLRARALPTLPILARSATPQRRDGDLVIAAVDALRGEWMTQTFAFEGGEPQALEAPSLRTARWLAEAETPVVGFQMGELEDAGAAGERLLDAAPLAPFALDAAHTGEWDAGTLVQPIYFRPPAAKRLATPPLATPGAGT